MFVKVLLVVVVLTLGAPRLRLRYAPTIKAIMMIGINLKEVLTLFLAKSEVHPCIETEFKTTVLLFEST